MMSKATHNEAKKEGTAHADESSPIDGPVAHPFAMGVAAIAPAGIVLGVLTGTEQTKLQVATGDYNRMIDQRVANIKITCGLP